MKTFFVVSVIICLFAGFTVMINYKTISVQDNVGKWHKINYHSIEDLNKKIHHLNIIIYIGDDIVFGENVKLGYGTLIDNYAHIGRDVQIFSYSSVGRYSRIAESTTVGNCVTIGRHVTIGNDVKIDHNIKIDNGVEIKSFTNVDSNVTK